MKCNCDECISACQFRPGWFLPSQINKLKEYFKVKTIRDLLGPERLAIDWANHVGIFDEDVLILAPNIIDNDCIQYPRDPRRQCVFLDCKNKTCRIYCIRPYECAWYNHDRIDEEIEKNRDYIIKKWAETDILESFRSEVDCYEMSIYDYIMMQGQYRDLECELKAKYME